MSRGELGWANSIILNSLLLFTCHFTVKLACCTLATSLFGSAETKPRSSKSHRKEMYYLGSKGQQKPGICADLILWDSEKLSGVDGSSSEFATFSQQLKDCEKAAHPGSMPQGKTIYSVKTLKDTLFLGNREIEHTLYQPVLCPSVRLLNSCYILENYKQERRKQLGWSTTFQRIAILCHQGQLSKSFWYLLWQVFQLSFRDWFIFAVSL
jgi:hypothetical protein